MHVRSFVFRGVTHAILLPFIPIVLSSCAGNGEGLNTNGRPTDESSTSSVLTADFNSIQANVFTPICTVCHSGANAPRGLRLDAANSYALLVGVASGEVPALQRVRPGDPNASYLIQKLTGAAAIGQRMPLGGPYLPQETIDVIRQWITNGAPRPVATSDTTLIATANTAGANDLQVAVTSPLPDENLTASVKQLVIGFNRELDASLVNDSTIKLEQLREGATTLENSSTLIAVQVSVALSNPSTMLVTSPVPLAAGSYQLRLRGSGGGALAGINGQPLNAIASSEFGRDYTLTFTVGEQQ